MHWMSFFGVRDFVHPHLRHGIEYFVERAAGSCGPLKSSFPGSLRTSGHIPEGMIHQALCDAFVHFRGMISRQEHPFPRWCHPVDPNGASAAAMKLPGQVFNRIFDPFLTCSVQGPLNFTKSGTQQSARPRSSRRFSAAARQPPGLWLQLEWGPLGSQEWYGVGLHITLGGGFNTFPKTLGKSSKSMNFH